MRLYGKVSLNGHFWVIETEPQVSLRIKRVFQKIHKADFGKVHLAATPENSRELEWFLERYPMEIEDPDELKELANEHRRIENIVANIVNRDDYEPTEFDMAVPARDYQKIAADLAMKTGRLLCADDVGLGKTATAICTFTDPENLPVLVVTLTHLPKQWEQEIHKFAPKLRTHIVKKGTPYDMTKGPRGKKVLFPDVILINYHKLAGWAESIASVVNTVVFDECQELRRSVSLKYGAACHITEKTNLKIGLSATPIYNYGGEIFNVVSALSPGSLGSHDEFMREWCYNQYGDRPRIKEPKAFGAYLREHGLMLRRTRKEVGRELESLNKVPHAISADASALDRIEDSAAELAKIILAQTRQEKGLKMRASEELSNVLRQATGIAKAPYVADFVRILVESGEPVVLYGWHREVYKIWEAKLRDLNPVFYTGTESANQKARSRDAFLLGSHDSNGNPRGGSDILIMSLRSGAGLDGLQARCRTVVFGELDWSPGVHDQCAGRVHRDGQEHPVMAYFLIAEAGSDPIVADVLGVKRAQMQGIRDPNADLIERTQAGDGNARKLAEAFLKQRGIRASEPEVAKVIPFQLPMKSDDSKSEEETTDQT